MKKEWPLTATLNEKILLNNNVTIYVSRILHIQNK